MRLSSERPPARRVTGLAGFVRDKRLNWLLIFVPISLLGAVMGMSQAWLFVASALSIIPLSGLMADATEEVAHRVGPGLGGLLNATFGNAAELIIALFALRAGLQELVKASISGSIIGNILLVLGLSALLGGWGRQKQTFNRTRIGASAAMLLLAVVALVMPAVYDLAVFGSLEGATPQVESLSLMVSAVLILTYLASLVFSLRTHRDVITSTAEVQESRLSLSSSVILLVLAAAVVAVESEVLVGSVGDAKAAFGMTEFFMGVVVVAVIGNAAEHSSAVLMALKDKMELSVTIAIGSSTQVALFVAPVLVFASLAMGSPMSFVFNIFEVVGIALAVLAVATVSADGESNWFEGFQLLAVYLVLAIVFYFVPGSIPSP